MKRFFARLKNLVTRQEGATMVEYGLMVALIAVVCLVAVGLLGTNVAALFENVSDEFTPPAG